MNTIRLMSENDLPGMYRIKVFQLRTIEDEISCLPATEILSSFGEISLFGRRLEFLGTNSRTSRTLDAGRRRCRSTTSSIELRIMFLNDI